MRILIVSLVLSISSVANAAVKQLSCEIKHGDVLETREFIFDTDDFSKENPEADTILVKTNEDPDLVWIDATDGAKFGIPITTYYETYGVGKTYRTNFEVTPTFLTFNYFVNPECRSAMNYASASKTICVAGDKPQPLSISRKTLTGIDDDYSPPKEFSCEISDFSTQDNAI